MRLFDFGSAVAALSIAEWFVWAAIALVFGKRALLFAVIVARIILRWFAVASATLATVLVALGAVAVVLVLATH